MPKNIIIYLSMVLTSLAALLLKTTVCAVLLSTISVCFNESVWDLLFNVHKNLLLGLLRIFINTVYVQRANLSHSAICARIINTKVSLVRCGSVLKSCSLFQTQLYGLEKATPVLRKYVILLIPFYLFVCHIFQCIYCHTLINNLYCCF